MTASALSHTDSRPHERTNPLHALSSVAELPSIVARQHGDEVALRLDQETLTYRGLAERSNRVAQALLRDGLAPGDRIALLGRDSFDLIVTLFGAAKAKAVAVPINWRLAPEEIAYIIQDAAPKIIFFDPEFSAGLSAIPPDTRLVAFTKRAAEAQAFGDWCSAAPGEVSLGSYAWDEVVVQLYTSGTTGHPKGVLLGNRTFFALAQEMFARGDPWIGWNERDVTVLFIPTFHIGGLWWLMRSLAVGASVIPMPAFDPGRILDAISRYRVTKVCMVPAMMQVLLAEPGRESTDFSSLDTIVYGGSPMATALLERARSVFGCDFCQIYGLTETGNCAVSLRPDDHRNATAERLLAAGRPLPGVEVRITRRDGRPAGIGEVGEIALRSPARMIGYWNLPEATRATLVDGWVITGDGGYRDEEGYVYVCDRIKDMIICAGENVYPAEIENALRSHESVADVAVIGTPDDLWGEAVLAFVVPRAGAHPSARDLIRHARTRLADFKVPRSIEFVPQLPRNASGKLLKHKLREPYWRGRQRRVN